MEKNFHFISESAFTELLQFISLILILFVRYSMIQCIQLKNNSEMRNCDVCENEPRMIGQNL